MNAESYSHDLLNWRKIQLNDKINESWKLDVDKLENQKFLEVTDLGRSPHIFVFYFHEPHQGSDGAELKDPLVALAGAEEIL